VLITLAGLPGSGTSTVGREVAARLGLDHLDGGSVFRALAAEAGMSLAEFAAVAEGDDRIDRALDDRLTERARAGDVLLESRLSAWLVTRAGLPALRVLLECDEVERARRVAGRDGHDPEAAVAVNRAREASERARYLAYYDIDVADTSVYDLVLDSTATPPADLVAAVVEAARRPATP
jgi:predicted cytidylate kinase